MFMMMVLCMYLWHETRCLADSNEAQISLMFYRENGNGADYDAIQFWCFLLVQEV